MIARHRTAGRIALAALLAATGLGLGQARAQYDRDDGYGRPGGQSYGRVYRDERPDEDEEDDREERRPRDFGRDPRGDDDGPRMGSVCVTSRGDCPAYPGPIETPCRCDIPGFGPKRGTILR